MRMRTDITRRDRLILLAIASPFLLMGLYIVAIGLGWLPVDPARIKVPGWVLALCGLPFVGGGVVILSFAWSRESPVGKIIAVVAFIGVSVVTHWVAFGPGTRDFYAARKTARILTRIGPIDEATGRRRFGAGAIVLDVMLVGLVVVQLRNSRLRRRSVGQDGPRST